MRWSSVFFAVAVVALVALLALSYWKFQQQDIAVTSPQPTSAESASAAKPSVVCVPEDGPLPSMLSSDPCPGAVEAINAAIADVRLEADRIAIEPGPFFCDEIWPGVGSPAVCFGVNVQPGQYMHGWVRFRDTDRVAAVMLGLDLPKDTDEPGATRPPWNATLVALEVPPAGWVMP